MQNARSQNAPSSRARALRQRGRQPCVDCDTCRRAMEAVSVSAMTVMKAMKARKAMKQKVGDEDDAIRSMTALEGEDRNKRRESKEGMKVKTMKQSVLAHAFRVFRRVPRS